MPAASLSVPHYKQEWPYSCVAACVRMVLAHYGRLYTEEEVRQLLGTGPHGTRARAILQVVTLGFDVQLGRSSLAELLTALRSGFHRSSLSKRPCSTTGSYAVTMSRSWSASRKPQFP